MRFIDSFNENRAVGHLAEIVALECGYSPARARQIRAAAALHDIGKQKIPAEILDKPGKLDAREFEIMKTHTTLGTELLASMRGALGEMARVVALYHHEWHDGGGYWGRRMGELPLYVAITGISDVFVALVSKRVYKDAWPPHDALAYIESMTGTQFDPALAGIFIPLVRCDSRVRSVFGGGDLIGTGGNRTKKRGALH